MNIWHLGFVGWCYLGNSIPEPECLVDMAAQKIHMLKITFRLTPI